MVGLGAITLRSGFGLLDNPDPVAAAVHGVLGYVGLPVVVLAAVAATFQQAHLAERIPDAPLAGKMRRTAGAAAVFFAFAIPFAMSGAVPDSGLGSIVSVFGVVTLVGAVVSAIMLMGIWWSFHKPLQQCLAGADGGG